MAPIRKPYARSGLSQRRYCRTPSATDTTFARWLRAIIDAEAANSARKMLESLPKTERDERRRQRRGRPARAVGGQTQPGYADVPGDGCGDAELERNEVHALRRGDKDLEVQPALLARYDR